MTADATKSPAGRGRGNERDLEMAKIGGIATAGRALAKLDNDVGGRMTLAAASGAARAIPGQLAAARKSAGLTQDQVAAALGVARETVSRWERGTVSPSLAEAACWAAAVGYRIDVTGRVTGGA